LHPIQAIVLALVQGITEFLPISSSAHLILVSRWMGWLDQGLHFDMAVHAGSLVAIVVYLRHDLSRMLRSLGPAGSSTDPPFRRLALHCVVATVPVALLGWWLQESIETYAREPLVIAVCSVVFGVLLWVADRWGRRNLEFAALSWRDVLLIGAAQALALLPGTSRSGVVMTAGLGVGLSRTAAARFSFLLAVPVMLLVSGKSLFDLLTGAVVAPDWPALVLGFGVSAVSAWLAVDWLLRWLRRQGMAIFAVYRVILGLAIIALSIF